MKYWDSDHTTGAMVIFAILAVLNSIICGIRWYDQAQWQADYNYSQLMLSTGHCRTAVPGAAGTVWTQCPRSIDSNATLQLWNDDGTLDADVPSNFLTTTTQDTKTKGDK